MLSLLTVDYDPEDSIGRLRRRLKDFIVSLRRGKKVERSREQEHAACEKAREEHAEELQRVREMWPQVLPQSVKNQRIHIFREQTGSEALSTFTCAVCAESKLIAPHELYQKLTEGTLVLVMLSFATYVITGQTTEAGRPIPNKKVSPRDSGIFFTNEGVGLPCTG
jgi:hypothetical protein